MASQCDSTPETVPPEEPPKKKRWYWYLQFPFWFFGFIMWFGVDTLLLKNIPLLLMVIFVCGTLRLIDKGMKRLFGPLPKARTWRATKLVLLQMVAWFALAFAILCVMRFWVPPVAISKQTTYLTAPLTADGWEIDLAKAVNERFAPKAKLEENGFRTVVRLFGPEQVFGFEPDRREEYTLRFLQQLELPAEQTAQLKFQCVYDFFKTQLEAQDLPAEEKDWPAVRSLVGKMLEKPWKTDDFEGSEHWLRENAEALDRFGEAVRMPVYFAPLLQPPDGYVAILDCLSFESNFHRNIVRSLHCRVMHSLAEGNIEKAIYDTETILRLANVMIARPAATTQYFVTQTIQSIGLRAVHRILEFGDLSKEQIEHLRAIVRKNQATVNPADLVFLSRIEGMTLLYAMASGRILDFDDLPKDLTGFERQWALFMWGGLRFAWNSVFTQFQERIDRLDAIVALPVSYSQYRAVADWDENGYTAMEKRASFINNYPYLVFQKGIYQLLPDILGGFISGITVHHILSHYRGVVQLRQTEIAVALELFRRNHGEYPQSLESLRGEYLDEIPCDPFTEDKPFHYSRLEPNGWAIYSVGPNGIDDGGYNKSERKSNPDDEQKDGDDIRVFIER